MAEESKEMKPIWYFVGWILSLMGGLIFLSGIYYVIYPERSETVLSHLYPDIWWGAVMTIAGVLFLLFGSKPGEQT